LIELSIVVIGYTIKSRLCPAIVLLLQIVCTIYGPATETVVKTAPITVKTIQIPVNVIPNNIGKTMWLHGLQEHKVPKIPTIIAVAENPIKTPKVAFLKF